VGALKLLLEIAFTHIYSRLRQTAVAVSGVSLGVGFSIAMTALLTGSQRDFVAQLVDAIPHILVSDERRSPPVQPAAARFEAIEVHGLRPKDDPRGIRNPPAVLAAIRRSALGPSAPGLSGQAVIRYSGKDVGITLSGVDQGEERRVSKVTEQMKEGSFANLSRILQGIVLGDGLAAKLGVKMGDTVIVTSSRGLLKRFQIVGLFHTGVVNNDQASGYVSLK
jgi:lipoprotein-releasing system permease protein